MTKPFLPIPKIGQGAAGGFGTPAAILAPDFAALAEPERKIAILLAAESGCLAQLVRKASLTRRGIERALRFEPLVSPVCEPREVPSTHLKGQAFVRWMCDGINSDRRRGGHAPGDFFKPDWMAMARDLDRSWQVVRRNMRRMVREGWLEQRHAAEIGGTVLIAVPQSTIDELGLEP